MLTEVVTRATEARHRRMCAGPHETYEAERYDDSSAPRAYNWVLGSFAGTAFFGIVVNDVRKDAGVLQIHFAGTAPNVGEYHSAFPSDCLPWSTHNGSFEIGARAPRDEIAEACAALVGEWKALGRAYARSDRMGQARWLPGCPVRVSCGGVGGNRMLLFTPEPASWVLWLEVSSNLRYVNLASLAEVDWLDDPAESPSQLAKQKSAGGVMAAYSSKNSAQCRAG